MTRLATTTPFGFNVIGYVSSTLGLAVAARNTIRTLTEAGLPVVTHDVSRMVRQGAGTVTTFDHLAAPAGEPSPYAVNLFHMNPPEIIRLAYERPDWLDLGGKLNVCVPFWELPRFPRPWLPGLRAMDAILAPTRFILAMARADLHGVPSFHYPQTVFLPDDVRSDRIRWDFPRDTTVFVTSFDASSDLERKNPWAAIEAFERAFPLADSRIDESAPPRAMLVVKFTSHGMPVSLAHTVTSLHERAAGHPHVRVLEDHLDYRDVLSLYASSDVILSLHRSEGLGLVLLEAMTLGRPVVATGWSGNMDFMSPEDSLPVPYTLVPARGSQTQYGSLYVGRGVEWAEPDVETAAMFMRTLADDPALRAEMGARARNAAARIRASDRLKFMDQLRCLIHGTEPVIRQARSAHPARAARLASLKYQYALYRAAAHAFTGLRARLGDRPSIRRRP